MKRIIVLFLAISCFLTGVLGCTKEPAQPEQPESTPAPVVSQEPQRQPRKSVSETLVGFVLPDMQDDLSLSTSAHGFLRTAENLGYPAKLYRAPMGEGALAAVEEAAADGCKGLLVWNPGGQNANAIALAAEKNIPVVVPYHTASEDGVVSNVAVDLSGYAEEAARGIAERMVERECKAGKILVYGKAPQAVAAEFTAAIQTYYPQYNVSAFVRTAATEEAAISQLAEHILWNRDIKGLFCTDPDGAVIAVRAREQAQKEFKTNGAPEAALQQSPAPSPTPAPTAAAVPTPAPVQGQTGPLATPVPAGLIKSITITAAGYGISNANIEMMEENDIYAFVLEPYYEASAQALMVLDRILDGATVPKTNKINMPIVRQDTLNKYVLVYEQVKEWFFPDPVEAVDE